MEQEYFPGSGNIHLSVKLYAQAINLYIGVALLVTLKDISVDSIGKYCIRSCSISSTLSPITCKNQKL